MRPLLVLGATGFLGRQVTARARSGPVEVVTASRREGAADLRVRPGELAATLRAVGPSAVLNCAGAVAGSPATLVEGNVLAVAELLAAVRAHPCRLVHLGSAAEYGVVPSGVPVTEDAEPHPVGAYGVTKLAGTSLVLGRPDTVVLRVFNPIGPGSPPSSLLGRIRAQLAPAGAGPPERRVIRVGALGAVRDFVDSRDVAEAVLAAAASATGGVLNVGSGRATLTRDLVDELVGLVPGAELLEEDGGSERSGGVPWQQADISAIDRALGWRPVLGLSASLKDLLEDTC
ncbi:MAG: NAD(P)-dependent oxidoreductase [Streptosporangiaceae bacterium]